MWVEVLNKEVAQKERDSQQLERAEVRVCNSVITGASLQGLLTDSREFTLFGCLPCSRK